MTVGWPSAPLAEPTPDDVIAVSAELFGVEPDDLRRAYPTEPMRTYRRVTMAACRMGTRYGAPSIARALRIQGHKTVIVGSKRVSKDPALREKAETIVAVVRRRWEAIYPLIPTKSTGSSTSDEHSFGGTMGQ